MENGQEKKEKRKREEKKAFQQSRSRMKYRYFSKWSIGLVRLIILQFVESHHKA